MVTTPRAPNRCAADAFNAHILAAKIWSRAQQDTWAAALLFFSSVALYTTTMVPIGAGPMERPLKDLGFDLVPRAEWTAFATDGVGLAFSASTAAILFLSPNAAHRDAARECANLVSIGNLFSASLHSVTLLPACEFAPGFAAAGPLKAFGIMGGESDKLMSNHVFNVGGALACHA